MNTETLKQKIRSPRTDPYVRNYRIRLLPQVRVAKRSSGFDSWRTSQFLPEPSRLAIKQCVQFIMLRREIEELGCQFLDMLRPRNLLHPLRRHAGQRTRQLAGGCRDTVGIIGKVGGQEDRVLEVVGVPYGPQCRFQGIDDVAGGADLFAALLLVLARIDDHRARPQRTHRWGQGLLLVCTIERQMQLCRKQLTAVHCLVGVLGHAALRDAFPPACRQRVPHGRLP